MVAQVLSRMWCYLFSLGSKS